MTTPPMQTLPVARTNSLALSFQDVITVVLRMRYGTQRVADAAGFRASIRKMIATAVQEVRNLGYSDATSHMALYAIIGFLDESVLNSQDPTFADWSRRPLQEEMFGGHFAGETFFRQIADLLNAPESSEVADALELHALCLLLGYRGKYAFGDSGEIHGILSRIRDKILRIRGPLALARLAEVPAIQFAPKRDKWLTTLWIAAATLAILILTAFAIYTLTLGSGIGAIQTAALLSPLRSHPLAAAFFTPLRSHPLAVTLFTPLRSHPFAVILSAAKDHCIVCSCLFLHPHTPQRAQTTLTSLTRTTAQTQGLKALSIIFPGETHVSTRRPA